MTASAAEAHGGHAAAPPASAAGNAGRQEVWPPPAEAGASHDEVTAAADEDAGYSQVLPTATAVVPGIPHLIVSHAGEQKRNLVDHLRVRFNQKHPELKVFVDEWSLLAGDRARERISAACWGASVGVVILSKEFVRKKHCMAELAVLLQRWKEALAAGDAASLTDQEAAAAPQQTVKLLPVLYGLTVEQLVSMRALYDSEDWCVKGSKPPAAVLDRWAAELQEVARFTVLRPDQSCGDAQLVDWIVERAVQQLDAAGKLPKPAPAALEVRNHVTPPPKVALVGRQHDLEQALRSVRQQGYVEIRGPPGEGKSTLAQHLVAAMCQEWSQLSQEAAGAQAAYMLEVDMRGLTGTGDLKKAVAQKLLATVKEEAKGAEWEALLGWVRRQRRVAVLFENAEAGVLQEKEAFGAVLAELQSLQNVRLLVCTRVDGPVIPGVWPGSAVVLPPLTEAEGLQLVEAHLGPDHTWSADGRDKEAARQLVRRVEGNALVLTIAASLVTAKDLSWQEVCAKARSKLEELMPRARSRPGGMSSHMVLLRKWLGSFLNQQEQQLLARLTVFAGSFTAAGAAAVTARNDAATDLQQLVFASLLVQRKVDNISSRQAGEVAERYSMHTLVSDAAAGLDAATLGKDTGAQQFIHWMLLHEEGPGQALMRCEPAGLEPDMVRFWYLLREELLNFTAAAAAMSSADAHEPFSTTSCVGRPLWFCGYSATKQLAEDVPELLHVGRLLSQCGHSTAARQLHEAAVMLSMRVLGPQHHTTLDSKGNLASTLCRMGELGQARQLQLEVLEARTRVLGAEHLGTLTSKNNLALTLKGIGELGQARQQLEEVLEACRRVLGPEHPHTLTSKGNLAATLRSMGELGQAMQLKEEVLEACTRVLGPEHPDTLMSKGDLADTLRGMGELGQARQLQEEVLAAHTRVLGPEHPHTLTSKCNLALTLEDMGKPGQARQLEEEVLEVRTRVLGAEHPDTLTSKNNLAWTLRAMGELGHAQQLQEEVLEACTRVLGPEHPDTLISKANLAATLRVMGELGQAWQLHEEVLEAHTRGQGSSTQAL